MQLKIANAKHGADSSDLSWIRMNFGFCFWFFLPEFCLRTEGAKPRVRALLGETAEASKPHTHMWCE